jgi:XTP/dITP diphosphohydrolase
MASGSSYACNMPPSNDTPETTLLATRSADKARELRAILAGLAQPISTLDEIGLEVSADEEDLERFETFRENALAKARYFARYAGRTVIADDSGIAVDALGGMPGVRSKRFAPGESAGLERDAANNAELLDHLRNVPSERRTARYFCAAALARPDGTAFVAIGSCSGIVLEQARGSAGFGYDPLFLIPELGRTFAELSLTEKNRRSHRAHAFRALAALGPFQSPNT